MNVMMPSQQEINKRLRELKELNHGENEIRSLRKIIADRDKRIVELEAEINVLMRILKGKI